MSVISAERAEQMNQLVRNRIDSHLFLTCNYVPTDVPAPSSSAKFYLGIQDLYKFTVDTSCIINYLWKYAPSSMERNFVNSFRSQVNDIQDLRAVIDHSQSETGGFFAREYLRHYDSIVWAALNKCKDKDKVKLRPEDEKDFELLYADLEARSARLLGDLESFIEQVAVSDQKANIVENWTKAILDWYSRKQDIYLGLLGNTYQAKMVQKQGLTNAGMSTNLGESVSGLQGFQMRGKLNRWIERALFADLDKQLDSCIFIINESKDIKAIKKATARRDECYQKRQDREKLIGEDCRDYFFKNLRRQLEDTMASYSGGLLPQELLQADINRVFDGVDSQDF